MKIASILRGLIIILLVLLNGLLSFTDYINIYLKDKGFIANFVILILWSILEIYKQFKSERKEEKTDIKLKEISTNIDYTKKVSEETNKIINNIDENIKRGKEKRLEKYKKEKVELLVDLVNEQLIPIETIKETIKNKDKRFISVLFYSEGFKKQLPQNYPKSKMKRKYKEIFDGLGFVQLAYSNKGYFIISEDNLYPEKLRNLDNLASYLLLKSKKCFDEEWNIILEDAKTNHPIFYRNRKNNESLSNATLLISRLNISEMRHCFTKENKFNKDFNRELISIAETNKININEKEKIKIKEFVLKSSLNILISNLNIKDKTQLLDLEPIFKKDVKEGGLGINFFYEYHKRNKNDIFNIIYTKFKDKEKAQNYTELIYKNSKKYEKDLRELGINLE